MLFIATPLYENKVSSQYLHGLMQTANLFMANGLGMQYALELGTEIAVNREKLVRRFMKTDCQFFMSIDAATIFTPNDILQLMATDLDVVSGLYRLRKDVPVGVPHAFRDMKGNPIITDNLLGKVPEVQQCMYMPGGMLLIRRTVFEQLYSKHQFVFDQGFRDTEYFQKLCGDFEDEVLTHFEGEDVHFCKIWHEMGGQMFVNTNVRVGHIGEKIYKICKTCTHKRHG